MVRNHDIAAETKRAVTTVRLDDGARVDLGPREVERVFDELWLLAPRTKGAVSAAAKLKAVDAWTLLHGDDVLTTDESSAFREALRRALPR